MSIAVFGSINCDVVAYLNRLPKAGETLHGERYKIGLGGKGANQAVAAWESFLIGLARPVQPVSCAKRLIIGLFIGWPWVRFPPGPWEYLCTRLGRGSTDGSNRRHGWLVETGMPCGVTSTAMDGPFFFAIHWSSDERLPHARSSVEVILTGSI